MLESITVYYARVLKEEGGVFLYYYKIGYVITVMKGKKEERKF